MLFFVFSAFWYFSAGLPDYKKLSNYQPPVSSRVYADNGKLIAEYALEKRLFIPYESIPKKVINSFLSAEDKNFFSHPGIDAKGIDLVPFPPYTIEGDIHNIDIPDNSLDLIFTNIVDHSLYPAKFCSEMERICKPQGNIIIHLQRGIDGDIYSENMIRDPEVIISYFKKFKLCENRKIKNSFDLMNWEIILEKN